MKLFYWNLTFSFGRWTGKGGRGVYGGEGDVVSICFISIEKIIIQGYFKCCRVTIECYYLNLGLKVAEGPPPPTVTGPLSLQVGSKRPTGYSPGLRTVLLQNKTVPSGGHWIFKTIAVRAVFFFSQFTQ